MLLEKCKNTGRTKTIAACILLSLVILIFINSKQANAETTNKELKAQQMLGKKAFFRCRACHDVDKGASHKIGPNLHGLFGRKAGGAEGFNYSDAVMASEVIWNHETLELWLKNPAGFIPNNTMAYAGTKSAKELAALLAYLEVSTR